MIILIDVDGCACEFHPAYVKTASVVLGREFYGPIYGESWHIEETLGLTEAEAEKVWASVNAVDYAKNLSNVEHAVEVIRRLAKKHEVAFVTSPLKSSPTWHYDRMHWLKERFGDVTPNYISTQSKFLVDGDLLIEDHVGHINAWLQRRQDRGHTDAFAITYARPYNAVGVYKKFEDRNKRLDNWLAIEKYIENWLGG